MGAMTDTLLTSQLMTPLYASTAMRAIMNDRARLQRMLDFEAALARAEAAVGVIGATAAVVIGDGCDAAHYDIAALVEAQIGGKLAQLGQRLVNGAAKKLADDFFVRFAAAVKN